MNSRLDELQAAILRAKLPRLAAATDRRRALAALYGRELSGLPLRLPVEQPYARAVYHLYVVQVPDRDNVQKKLAADGVETGIHYPIPLHEQPAYAHLGHKPEDFPVSQQLGPRAGLWVGGIATLAVTVAAIAALRRHREVQHRVVASPTHA